MLYEIITSAPFIYILTGMAMASIMHLIPPPEEEDDMAYEDPDTLLPPPMEDHKDG